jgi:pilus assembly protein Flp/PilA
MRPSFKCKGFQMKKLLTRFRRAEEGAALAEYALLVALVALVCIVAITTLGTQISTQLSTIASAIGGA